MVKKRWKIAIIVVWAACVVMSNTVAAANGVSRTIQILETVQIEESVFPKGRMALPQAGIESGKTVSFLDSDGSMFYVVGGTTINFSVDLNVSASVQMGYIGSNGSKIQIYSGTGSSHSTSFKISNTGYYRFYVSNLSSSIIQVTGGTISF